MRSFLAFSFCLFLIFLSVLSVEAESELKPVPKECVILLHGLGRTNWSMTSLSKALEEAGYKSVNIDYPSRSLSVAELAEIAIGQAREVCLMADSKVIHYVTHSMGGILVRQYYQNRTATVGKRVVMIAPPNKGSELADYFKEYSVFEWILGPAALEMSSDQDSTPNTLGPIPLEVGVIAGTKSYVPWLSDILTGLDDGRVTVESTKLEEMKDFITVDSDHAVIMESAEVIDLVKAFLATGSFKDKN